MATYDPSKSYQWANDDIIGITGREFNQLLTATKAAISTPEAQVIIQQYELAKQLDEILKRAVAEDIVKEAGVNPMLEQIEE